MPDDSQWTAVLDDRRWTSCHLWWTIADGHSEIPRQLVYTYVENAIKHGLRPKNSPGNLHLSLQLKEERLLILIADNGIGLEESQRQKTHGTGKGLKVLDEIVTLYQQIKGVEIKLDVHSDHTGTKVMIVMPLVSI